MEKEYFTYFQIGPAIFVRIVICLAALRLLSSIELHPMNMKNLSFIAKFFMKIPEKASDRN